MQDLARVAYNNRLLHENTTKEMLMLERGNREEIHLWSLWNYVLSGLKCVLLLAGIHHWILSRSDWTVNLSICVHRDSRFEASGPKRGMNMNEKEGGVSEGGLNVTLTIRLLMHGKVRHITATYRAFACFVFSPVFCKRVRNKTVHEKWEKHFQFFNIGL